MANPNYYGKTINICLILLACFGFFQLANFALANDKVPTEKQASESESLIDLDALKTDNYSEHVQAKLKELWHSPQCQPDDHSILQFRVKKDGSIADVKVARAAKSSELQLKSIAVVQQISPVKPLPANMVEPVYLRFSFSNNDQVVEVQKEDLEIPDNKENARDLVLIVNDVIVFFGVIGGFILLAGGSLALAIQKESAQVIIAFGLMSILLMIVLPHYIIKIYHIFYTPCLFPMF